MTETPILTVRHLKAAIRAAKVVKVGARFGATGRFVKTTKRDAFDLAAGLDPNMTPEMAEMYGGRFGVLDGDTLYLG